MIFATDLDRTIIHSSKFIDNTSHVKCIEILDDKEVLKLRQYKLDSLEYGKFFKKNSPESLEKFKQTASEVKP